jgi:opacity protein-like surface antigen
MTRFMSGISATVLLLILLFAAPASAQTGFGLKGHLVYNASTAQTFQNDPNVDAAGNFAGFNLGAEYVLPMGLAFGVTGYASGDPRDTDRGTIFLALAEVNYYLDIPALPLSPFAGVHVGLGSFSWDVRDEGLGSDLGDLDRADFGWQLGARLQLMRGLAVEATYRRLSAPAEAAQNPGFESDQVLLGVRIF